MAASRMSDKEIKRWRDRLNHEHKVWAYYGMGDDEGDGGRHPIVRQGSMRHLIRAYRMDQWDEDWGGIERENLPTTPLFHSVANTWMAQLLARDPEIDVLPGRATMEEKARLTQALLNYDAYELKFFREWNAVIRDSFFSYFGIMRHGFTPAAEFEVSERLLERFAFARPDKPFMQRVAPWDVRIDSQAATPHSDGTARSVWFRSLMSLDEIDRNPKMTLPKDLKATRRRKDFGPNQRRGDDPRQRNPEELEMVEVWTCYEKEEKTWFALSPGSDKPLRKREDWPLPWEDLPYDALFFNDQMDDMFAVPPALTVFQSCVNRNKSRAINFELQKRQRRMIFYDKNKVSASQANAIADGDLTEMIGLDQGDLSNSIQVVNVANFDQGALVLEGEFETDTREALGQSQMDRGQRINVESATEAENVQFGSQINTARNEIFTDDFLSSTLRHYHQGRRATMVEEEIVPILGRKDGAALFDRRADTQFSTVRPRDIKGEFDVRVQPGSARPRNRENEVRQALINLKIAQADPANHDLRAVTRRYWEAVGIDPTEVMLNAQEQNALAQSGALNDPEGNETGAANDGGPLLQALS